MTIDKKIAANEESWIAYKSMDVSRSRTKKVKTGTIG
jgi:hypothetical protein